MPTPDLIQAVDLPIYSDAPAVPDDLATVWYEGLKRAIPRFSNAAQRDAAYPSPTQGQSCWVDSLLAEQVYQSGWKNKWTAPGPGIWAAYTPTLTNVALGTGGAITGRWTRDGNTVKCIVAISLGTGASVTDIIRIGVPVDINLTTHAVNVAPLGVATASDTTNRAAATVAAVAANQVRCLGTTTATFTAAAWRNAQPWAWASGHTLFLKFEYEAA